MQRTKYKNLLIPIYLIFNLLHKFKLLIFTGKSDNFLMKYYPYIFFICFILLLSFGCRKKTNASYPEPLAKAITYFYNENENDKVTDELNKLNPDLIQVTITTAIPGSQLFYEAKASNRILTYDWDKYEGSDQITEHENIDFKTLQKYYRKTYLKFYLRPSFIFRTLFKTNSLIKLKLLFSGIISIIPIIIAAIFNFRKK